MALVTTDSKANQHWASDPPPKDSYINKCYQKLSAIEISTHTGRLVKQYDHFNQIIGSIIMFIFYPIMPILGIYPREIKAYVSKKVK